MKLLKRLVVFALAIVALVIVIGFFLPNSAHVERSITTTASADTVYGIVSGFRRFNEWSPWADLDPKTRYVYSGPESGVGARLEWHSDSSDVGSGSQEIIAVEPGRSVKSNLSFDTNEATSTVTLAPQDGATRITWSFDSSFAGNFPGRYFGLMFDKFIGADYEKGLARLKALAEASTPTGETIAPATQPAAAQPAS